MAEVWLSRPHPILPTTASSSDWLPLSCELLPLLSDSQTYSILTAYPRLKPCAVCLLGPVLLHFDFWWYWGQNPGNARQSSLPLGYIPASLGITFPFLSISLQISCSFQLSTLCTCTTSMLSTHQLLGCLHFLATQTSEWIQDPLLGGQGDQCLVLLACLKISMGGGGSRPRQVPYF